MFFFGSLFFAEVKRFWLIDIYPLGVYPFPFCSFGIGFDFCFWLNFDIFDRFTFFGFAIHVVFEPFVPFFLLLLLGFGFWPGTLIKAVQIYGTNYNWCGSNSTFSNPVYFFLLFVFLFFLLHTGCFYNGFGCNRFFFFLILYFNNPLFRCRLGNYFIFEFTFT